MRYLLGILCVLLGLCTSAWAVGPVVSTACRLTWTAPTTNSDGTPLTDLAAYRVYVGTASGVYGAPTATVTAPATTWPCGGLPPGQKYAVVTAVDLAGNESARSNEAPFVFDPIAPAAPSGLTAQ